MEENEIRLSQESNGSIHTPPRRRDILPTLVVIGGIAMCLCGVGALAFFFISSGDSLTAQLESIQATLGASIESQPDDVGIAESDGAPTATATATPTPAPEESLAVRQIGVHSENDVSMTVQAVVWSPDGGRFATSANREIIVWDTTGASVVMQSQDTVVDNLAFSADGTRLLGVGPNILIWDTATGAVVLTFEETFHWKGIAVNLVDGRIALGVAQGATIRNGSTGALLLSLSTESPIQSVSWSPDGTRLAGLDMNGRLHLWDAQTGNEIISDKVVSAFGTVEYTPDGAHIIATPNSDPPLVLDSQLLQVQATLGTGRGAETALAADRTGTLIVTSGFNELMFWRTDGTMAFGPVDVEVMTTFDVAPNGRDIAFGNSDGEVWLGSLGQ